MHPIVQAQIDAAAGTWDGEALVVSKHADTISQVADPPQIPPSGWKCRQCDLRNNLWLNLTDGSVLCGRRFFDGSGGNNHAVEHWNASLRAILEYAEVAQILPLLYEDLTATETTLNGVAQFLAIDPKPLRLRWQTNLRREPRPEPGAGEQQLNVKDAAFVRDLMDHDAIARVTQLSRRVCLRKGSEQVP